MRSKELADFAGVSVRTLRHYHALGLLDEPPRSANGYRDYRAADAVRVLRIKNLASLGFSLQQIKDLKQIKGLASEDDADASIIEALDALDAELAEEARHIEEKRRLIRDIKEGGCDPDVPPVFSAHLRRLREGGASDELIELERSGLFLAERDETVTKSDIREVVRLLELIAEIDGMDDYIRFSEALYALPPDCPEDERQLFVEDFAQWFVKLLERGSVTQGWDLQAGANALSEASIMGAYDDEVLNEAQLDVSNRIAERAFQIIAEGS